MKLAIDCRALRKKPSGIPNFLLSAINGMARQNPDWQLYLLSNERFHPELQAALEEHDNVQTIISPLPFLNKVSFFWFLFKIQGLLDQIKPDIFWAPAFLLPPFISGNIKTLVTVHDMVFKEYKETMSGANKLFFQLLHDKSLNKADMLWCNSHYTKAGIEKYFPNRKCRNVFTGFFINTQVFKRNPISKIEREYIYQKFNLNDKFLLFVGTREPRKNLEFLLSLMPALAAQGYYLLVIGAKGWGDSEIKTMINSPGFPRKQVVFAGFLTSVELVKLYNLASVYVSTSWNEGFGMPQLEAMACGCPVVSPHNSAMIEVVEGAGETVKTWEEQEWISAINKVFNNREEYIKTGLQRVKDYQTEKVIKNLTYYLEQHL